MNGYKTRTRTRKKPVDNPVLFEFLIDGENNKTVISFTKHDYEQTKPPRFLNDTNISFFMQYHLENHVDKELRDKIHIFNSFFFDKIKSMKLEGSIKTCTSRWLKGVTLFDKDFLILPVCEKDHWILIIICYPYNTPTIRSYKIPDEKLYEPAVIVMNSFHRCAPSVKKILSQFLKFCWDHERGSIRSFTINNAKPNGIRLLFPSLPQQTNDYNCGVFILNYLYCFLKDPRGSYLRMFRKLPMTSWFKENKIDIGAERRKMQKVIEEQIKIWENSELKARLDRERGAISPSKDSTIVITEEDGNGNHQDNIIVIH